MKPGTEIAIEPPRCECCAAKCRILARIEGYTYWQCNACGYTFLPETADEGYTQRLYSDAYFFDGAFGYADYVAERALQRRHGAEFGRLLKRYARPGRILDVGCASGSMLQGFSDEGWSGEGMEPNATLAAIAREATGLPVYTQAMEDHLPALHRRFDAIAMIQVVAHFRSLTGALENAARYLRSNGPKMRTGASIAFFLLCDAPAGVHGAPDLGPYPLRAPAPYRVRMEERKVREKRLQDERFSVNGGSRGTVDRAYWITGESHSLFRRRVIHDAPGKRILELGCGAGANVRTLCEEGAYVTGIDLSETAIALARNSTPREILGEASFAVMDAERMEFPDRCFDIVIGGAILHHLDLHQAYREISRVLAPGGYALFIEPLGYNPFINLYRRLTPRLRTPDEHPLLMRDIDLAKRYFRRIEIQYFYLTTLLALPVAATPIGRRLIPLLNSVDRLLFRVLPVLRRFAWIVLIRFSQPV